MVSVAGRFQAVFGPEWTLISYTDKWVKNDPAERRACETQRLDDNYLTSTQKQRAANISLLNNIASQTVHARWDTECFTTRKEIPHNGNCHGQQEGGPPT